MFWPGQRFCLGIYTARGWAWGAVGLDIFFKIFFCGYMIFCAKPLARLTGNENILTAYFLADQGFFDWFSSWISGMMFFQKGAGLEILLYVVFIAALCFVLPSCCDRPRPEGK